MAKQANSTRIIVVVGIIALAGLAFLLLAGRKNLRWGESYRPEDKNPFGSFVFYSLLKHVHGENDLILIKDTLSKELPENPTQRVDNYLFLGNSAYLDSADTEALLRFVHAGNQVIFISDDVENRFLDSILTIPRVSEEQVPETQHMEHIWIEDHFIDEDDEFLLEASEETTYRSLWDSLVTLTIKGSSTVPCVLDRRHDYERTMHHWTYLHDSIAGPDGKPATVLGYMNKTDINFIAIPVGKGRVYVHTQPLAFTNYHLLNDTVHSYAREVMRMLGDGQIYWDEENRQFDWNAYHHSRRDRLPDEGPLEFVLSEPALRSAWYLLLLGGILYLIFGARRKQRVIPVLPNMDNTSIEYAEVISQLFMKQRDHTKLIILKMELFRAHLRERFMLKLPATPDEENEAFFQLAALKTGVNEALIRKIFKDFQYLSITGGVTTPQMLEFHQNIEQFYHLSK